MEGSYDSMMAAKSFLPYRMGYLTDWMVKKAEDELNETEDARAIALPKLRKLIADHKNLDVWTDDAYLLQFLRNKKFDVKIAWEALHTFYTLKKEFPDIYPRNYDFKEMRALGETNCAGAYNYRNADGAAVFYLEVRLWDPEKISIKNILIGLTALLLTAVEDPATQICGIHIIIDTNEFSWKHLRSFTPRYMMLLGKGLRRAFPIRINGIHILNEPALFSYFINFLKIFLSDKMKRRIHFHGSDMENLHKYISKEILPPQYGGVNAGYSGREWCRKELDFFIDRFSEMLCKGFKSTS